MPKTPKPLRLLLPLALALSLGGCPRNDPLTPDAFRFAPVALPVQPAGEADCDGQPCLSQSQVDLLFNQTIDQLCAANDKLAWLSDFYLRTDLPPSCGATQ
jgi:hypothetical protein